MAASEFTPRIAALGVVKPCLTVTSGRLSLARHMQFNIMLKLDR